MLRMFANFIILLGITIIYGCQVNSTRPDLEYAPIQPIYAEPIVYKGGAIYQAGQDIRLFEDQRASRPGDILKIILVENTDASKSATTAASKQNEVDISNPTIFGVPVDVGLGRAADLSMNLNSTSQFSGSGNSTQSNSLQGSISVVVSEVLANGNLVIKGEKIIELNQGDEYVRVSGIVRQQDIGTDNSILSTQIANAKIVYGGNGPVSNSNIVGWFANFFLKFSPF